MSVMNMYIMLANCRFLYCVFFIFCKFGVFLINFTLPTGTLIIL